MGRQEEGGEGGVDLEGEEVEVEGCVISSRVRKGAGSGIRVSLNMRKPRRSLGLGDLDILV